MHRGRREAVQRVKRGASGTLGVLAHPTCGSCVTRRTVVGLENLSKRSRTWCAGDAGVSVTWASNTSRPADPSPRITARPRIEAWGSERTRACFALRQPSEGLEFAAEAALVRPAREDPCHDRGDDPVRPKLLGQARAVGLVLEGGLLDALEKPAAETSSHQRWPVDLEDLARATHPAEPRGVARPRRGDRSCHVGDPSQPFDPLVRSIQVRPQIEDLFPWRPHLDNEAMVTHACSLGGPIPPAGSNDHWVNDALTRRTWSRSADRA